MAVFRYNASLDLWSRCDATEFTELMSSLVVLSAKDGDTKKASNLVTNQLPPIQPLLVGIVRHLSSLSGGLSHASHHCH